MKDEQRSTLLVSRTKTPSSSILPFGTPPHERRPRLPKLEKVGKRSPWRYSLVLDLGLAVYLWQGGRGNPREIRAEVVRPDDRSQAASEPTSIAVKESAPRFPRPAKMPNPSIKNLFSILPPAIPASSPISGPLPPRPASVPPDSPSNRNRPRKNQALLKFQFPPAWTPIIPR